jgi:hypothetical protein
MEVMTNRILPMLNKPQKSNITKHMKTFSMTRGQKPNFNKCVANIHGIGCPDIRSNVISMCYVKIQGV